MKEEYGKKTGRFAGELMAAYLLWVAGEDDGLLYREVARYMRQLEPWEAEGFRSYFVQEGRRDITGHIDAWQDNGSALPF